MGATSISPVTAEGRVCITESPGRKYEIVAAMR
jgi:hypothetical protein